MARKKPARAPTIFISFNIKDKVSVKELTVLLRQNGYSCVMAAENIQPGEVLSEKVKLEIEASSCLIAVCSKNGARSAWVNQEIGFAMGQEIPIIPISTETKYIDGLLQGTEYIGLDIDNPSIKAMKDLIAALKKRATKIN